MADLLKEGDSGRNVMNAQRLLSGRNVFRTAWYRGELDWLFGPIMAASIIACKRDLGYPQRGLVPTYGVTLQDYLTGAQKLPKAYQERRKQHAGRLVQPVPGRFHPSQGPVHETAGLPGYPAIDFLAPAGSWVVASEHCLVARFSGHDPALGPVSGPHGPFGWSMYLTGTASRTSYFCTHLGTRVVQPGMHVDGGQQIGTIGNYRKWGGDDHVHEGVKGGTVSIQELGRAQLA